MLVMTFNAANDFIAPDDLVTLIARFAPVVVGLQELSQRNAAVLEETLLDLLPYRILHGEYINGKGLLSCYPVVESERFGLASGRSGIDARLRIDGQEAAVFVVHPPPPDYRRREIISRIGLADVARILERLPADLPTLLLGDFNFVRPTRGYRLLQDAGLVDTFRSVGTGSGLTYPTRHQHARVPLPRMVRLDYIWASRHFLPTSSWVGPVTASDHLPLFSELKLEGV